MNSKPPSKMVMGPDGQLVEVPGHTIRVMVGLPLPDEVERAILWVLAREWVGFYFTFFTENEHGISPEPVRVLKARCWFPEGTQVTAKTKVVLRMSELVKMGSSFVSGSGFLMNLCNRDMLTEMVFEANCNHFSVEEWVGKGGE
jgi:hypothetical protein